MNQLSFIAIFIPAVIGVLTLEYLEKKKYEKFEYAKQYCIFVLFTNISAGTLANILSHLLDIVIETLVFPMFFAYILYYH